MRFRVPAALLLALAGAISISCGGITDPSQNQNESFSGTVAPAGFSVQKFSALVPEDDSFWFCEGSVMPPQLMLNQNESFSGTVAPGGFSVQKFSASKTGEISVKMGTITPAAVPALSLQWLGATVPE